MKRDSKKSFQIKIKNDQHNQLNIDKNSNYKVVHFIPEVSDDTKFSFLNYDFVNPYLSKNSNHSISKNGLFQKKAPILSLEQDTLDFELFSTVNPPSIPKKYKNQQTKLPSISNRNYKNRQITANQKISRINQKQKNLFQFNHEMSKQRQKQKTIAPNKNPTINTRIDTDDITLLQQLSMSSLLKIQANSLSRSLQSGLMDLKNSKIFNPEGADVLEKQQNFLQKYHLLSRNSSELSQRILLPPSKSISYQMIEEQEGTESQQQYLKNSVPGPGSYSVQQYSSFSRPLIRRIINKTEPKKFNFGSQQPRFKSQNLTQKNPQISQIGFQQYKKKQNQRQQRYLRMLKKNKKIVSFNSKQDSIKLPKPSYNQQIISPVYYNPRQGIEEELIRKIQRNFKGGFGVSQKRFKTIYRKQSELGSGSYNFQHATSHQNSKVPAYYFLSKNNRF